MSSKTWPVRGHAPKPASMYADLDFWLVLFKDDDWLADRAEIGADLVEHFMPVAIEETSGFAGFRETATEMNSLADRLEVITLPNPDDVTQDLKRCREAVKQAEELDEKIQHTDDLINEIVYERYELTDEEIEIVEDVVGGE